LLLDKDNPRDDHRSGTSRTTPRAGGNLQRVEFRALTPDDANVSLRMSRDAFGVPIAGQSAFTMRQGIHRWGLFDGRVLAAKTVDREYLSMIGGRPVTTAGIAGVAVAPEYRSLGLARSIMTDTLARARARGAVISTLFRTAPALYRSLGYEQVAELVIAELPVSALAGLRVLQAIRLRRAEAADAPAIRAVYAQLAAEGSCLLSRTGPCFTQTDAELADDFDGITLAIDEAGSVTGYASWHRGEGYGPGAIFTVHDLLGLTSDAVASLLAMAASFGAVTPTIRLRTSGADPVHWLIPGAGWTATDVRQYLLRVVDLVGAVEQRGWPVTVSGVLEISVQDQVCPWNTGRHRIVFDEGSAQVQSGSGSDVRMTPTGVALFLAGGGVSSAALRRAGMLSGGSPADDRLLDAAMAGPRPAILDYF